MDSETNQNEKLDSEYISADGRSAIANDGTIYRVGEKVAYQDQSVGTERILWFEFDPADNSVKACTAKGYAHLMFLVKLNEQFNPDVYIPVGTKENLQLTLVQEMFPELSVSEMLRLINSFDGHGMIATDEELQVQRIRELFPDLKDDYTEAYNVPDPE